MNVTLEKVSKPLAPTCPDWQALCVPDLDCNGSLRLFTEGDNLHEAMISAIEAAQRSIRLEVFIFAADEIGWRFARALASKALAGVEVRFHFDSRGAATGYSADLFREMMAAGVKLKWYRPWSWRHPTRFFRGTTASSSWWTNSSCSSAALTFDGRTLARSVERAVSGILTFRSRVSLHNMRRPFSIRCGTIRSTHTPMP
jgi:hypothetical protein